jgi:hypothetical protein
MFRYGGPIKEGVMSGIREPKRNGGSMREAQQWNTVGSSVFPKDSSGRAHHWLPAAGIVGTGIRAALPWAARGLKSAWRYIKPTSIPRNIATKSKSKLPVGLRGSIKDRVTLTPRSNWQMSKEWMKKNPGWTATGALSAYNAPGTYETGKGAAGLAWKGIKQAADLAVPDWIWDQDKWEKERAEKLKPPVGTVYPNEPRVEEIEEVIDPEAARLAKQKEWDNRIKKYRDIMDIKGMNKQAAYKSLIDASKLIQESGDFKGDIKSGKLINEVIQAASKQFDKPAKTSDAINTLILQNELKKDLESETNKDKKTLLKKQIQIADKTLQGATFSEVITDRIKRGEVPTGNTLATILRATEGVDAKVIPSSKLGEGEDPISFLEKQVAQAKEDGTFQPGAVVISSRVLIVDEAGNVKPFL